MLRTPFQIVLGTHEVTPVPTAARAFGLRHRFALVQSTHHPDAADMVVDPTALMVVLRALDQHSGLLGTLFWDDDQQEKITRLELEPHYRSRSPDEYQHVAAGEWRRGFDPSVLLITETWNAVGGPVPYHDSLTYSFYSHEDLSGLLLDALRTAGCTPTRIIEAPRGELSEPTHAGRDWPERLFLMAFMVLLLSSGLMMASELVDRDSVVADLISDLGWWFTAPAVISFLYASIYAVSRRRNKPRHSPS